jgi:tetratricopeptide (TPR) repeat protein
MLGGLQVELGDYGEGEKSLLRALEWFPGNNDASEKLCEMEMLKGDWRAALQRLAGSRSDSSQFWGFTSFGVNLFKGYLYLNSGLFSQAEAEFGRIRLRVPELATLCQAMGDLFKGNPAAAAAALRELEKQPLGAVDLRELRLLLARALLLDDGDLERAKFLFEDIFRNSLEYGHLAEISTWYLLARQGRVSEARQNASEAFARLQARARGDFMTRLWLFYDAYVFARTMDLAGDSGGAAPGYRACVEANPHTDLAARSRLRLKLLGRSR